MNIQMLQALATLSLLNKETTLKMKEVLTQLRRNLNEAQEAVNRLSLEEVFALVFPEGQRPEVINFTVEDKRGYPERQYLIGLLRDPRVPGFAVPVWLNGQAQNRPAELSVEIFTHQYVEAIRENNHVWSSDSISRSWYVATLPVWFDQTKNLSVYLEYYRCLLEAVRHTGIKQLYIPPQGYSDHWRHRMARFAFEQVRAELGIDCRLVEKYDPAFCEYIEGKLVLRSDVSLLLSYLP